MSSHSFLYNSLTIQSLWICDVVWFVAVKRQIPLQNDFKCYQNNYEVIIWKDWWAMFNELETIGRRRMKKKFVEKLTCQSSKLRCNAFDWLTQNLLIERFCFEWSPNNRSLVKIMKYDHDIAYYSSWLEHDFYLFSFCAETNRFT